MKGWLRLKVLKEMANSNGNKPKKGNSKMGYWIFMIFMDLLIPFTIVGFVEILFEILVKGEFQCQKTKLKNDLLVYA